MVACKNCIHYEKCLKEVEAEKNYVIYMLDDSIGCPAFKENISCEKDCELYHSCGLLGLNPYTCKHFKEEEFILN